MSSTSSNSRFLIRRVKRFVAANLAVACALSPFLFPVSAFADASTTPPTSDASTTPSVSGGTTTTVTTGDASSFSETDNQANVNVTDTNGDASSTPNQSSSDASTTPSEADGANGTGATTTIDVSNDNEAVVSTDASTTADTGDNSASGGAGGAGVSTGNAGAASNVVNVVNANITNSTALTVFLDNLLGSVGNINLTDALAGFNDSQTTNPCPSCNSTTTTLVSNSNSAQVSNNVVVRSSTGGNEASSTGDSSVSTGDAFAAGNVVNVVNTNLDNSNYLLMVFNNFGSWNGDLELPGAQLFQKIFDRGNGSGPATEHASDTNSASVSTNASTTADTGGNTATGTEATINTGNAVAISNVINNVNENLLNTGSFKLLIRVSGDWTGKVFGLPPGLIWEQTPDGVVIMNDPAAGGSSSSCCASTTLDVSNENSALVNNNVSVYALTGANKAGGDNSSVATGDAAAVSNVVNVVNTNVIGSNWLTAIVNVAGDWNGNVDFGKPDLWVGVKAQISGSYVTPGSWITYEFTVANRGDADATNVRLENVFGKPVVNLTSGPGEDLTPGDTIADIGDIKAGEVKTVSLGYHVVDELPYGYTDIPSTVTVSENEPDANMSDNSDEISVTAYVPPVATSGGVYVQMDPDPVINVTKTNDVPAGGGIYASSTVNYAVDIKNSGGPAYRAFLEDTLKDEWGNVISDNTWNLDTINPGEEIKVAYTTLFSSSTAPGLYTNYAQVHAISRNPSLNPFYGYYYNSDVATSTVLVIGPKGGTGSVPITGSATVIASSTTSIGGTTVSPPPAPPQPPTAPAAPHNGHQNGVVIPPAATPGGPFQVMPIRGKIPLPVFDGTVGETSMTSPRASFNSDLAAVLPAAQGAPSTGFSLMMFASLLFLAYVTQRHPKYRMLIRNFLNLF